MGAIVCRVVTCTPPWKIDSTCTGTDAQDDNTRFLRDPATGVADIVFQYGDPGDKVIIGDWNGDGVDTPCIVRRGVCFVRNSNTGGVADATFAYGNPDDIVLAGRWKKSTGLDGPGVAR